MGRLFGFLMLAILASTGAASAQDGYGIRPGDVLQIEVLEDDSLNRSALVLPDGSFSFPLVGTVRAGGRTVEQVRQTLSAELAASFAVEPSVFVTIGSLAARQPGVAVRRTMEIYIMGEVNAPGKKEVTEGTTLLQFLAETGGLSRFAAEKRIELRRFDRTKGEERVYRYNYRDRGGSNSISGTTVLAPGDVVIVPERRLFE